MTLSVVYKTPFHTLKAIQSSVNSPGVSERESLNSAHCFLTKESAGSSKKDRQNSKSVQQMKSAAFWPEFQRNSGIFVKNSLKCCNRVFSKFKKFSVFSDWNSLTKESRAAPTSFKNYRQNSKRVQSEFLNNSVNLMKESARSFQ